MHNRNPNLQEALPMFRKLTITAALAVAVVFGTVKQAPAQMAAPQLLRDIRNLQNLEKTNTYPYAVTNATYSVGVNFTNGPGRSTTCLTLKSTAPLNQTNQADLIDLTDGTSNSVNFAGISTNTIDCLCIQASPNDVLVLRTNQSTAGTGVSIIGGWSKQE